MASSYEAIIWGYFKSKIGNEYGVAGLMGNLQAESGLYPDRVENDIPYSSYSQEYTSKVDRGIISEYEFVNDGIGYGLAQWTYYTRKQALYNMYKDRGYASIGSIGLGCEYLWYELQNTFPFVLDILKNATTIRQASDIVLHDFENPAVQTEEVEVEREALSQAIYTQFTGQSGVLPDEPIEPTSKPKRKHYNFILFNQRRKKLWTGQML